MARKFFALVLLLLGLLPVNSYAWERGEIFPNLSLENGLDPAYQFKSLDEIESKVVVVQIFNMYCPHCQKDAPVVNKLYAKLRADFPASKVTLLGLGIGNTKREVEVFRNSFKIEFPLFWDEQNRFLELFGNLGTPYFFVLKKTDKGFRVVYMHAGELQDWKKLYVQIKNNFS
ncbi:MAG: hypothetical protein PWR24_1184 [Desulfonauticus sp.]|jgi:thiol-disulfide isomerase/thioredoxin|nr:hypothetical protein [Desulfonauticus sp.]